MSNPESNEARRPESSEAPASDAWGVLGAVVGRLRSQPLLLALGVVLLLAVVATSAAASLRPLLPYALAVFAIAVVAWLWLEIARLRARGGGRGAGYDVEVRATGVAKGGGVHGVANAPRDPGGAVRARVRADDVKGSVSGVTFGDPPKER